MNLNVCFDIYQGPGCRYNFASVERGMLTWYLPVPTFVTIGTCCGAASVSNQMNTFSVGIA
jgi:hypothetical protein